MELRPAASSSRPSTGILRSNTTAPQFSALVLKYNTWFNNLELLFQTQVAMAWPA